MCGRYSLHVPDLAELAALLGLERSFIEDWQPRYNIAPSQQAPVVVIQPERVLAGCGVTGARRLSSDPNSPAALRELEIQRVFRRSRRHRRTCPKSEKPLDPNPPHSEPTPSKYFRSLLPLRFGLIPGFVADASVGNRLINARVETVARLRSFRGAFAERRCLVPATGFFEWQALRGRRGQQPLWIHPKDTRVMTLAGIWETWRSPSGQLIGSFAIVTTEALEPLRAIHDRMPLELRGEQCNLWLRPSVLSARELESLVRAAAVEHLVADPVDPCVGSPANDDSRCISPVDSASPAEGRQLGLFD